MDLGRGDLGAAARNMTAFAGFVGGLFVGAALLRAGAHRAALLRTLLLEEALLAGFAVLWGLRGPEPWTFVLIGTSAVAMGVQSAVAHRIGVPGVSTTYFTGTLTNIVFGLFGREQGQPGRVRWPVLAVAFYVGGAAASGLVYGGAGGVGASGSGSRGCRRWRSCC